MITHTNSKPFYNSTIPSDWTSPEFGNTFSFLKSFSFSREQLTDEKTTDEFQCIHYGDIHASFENEILDFEIERGIPYVKDELLSKDLLNDEDLPLLKDGDLIIADASEDYVGVAECIELKNIKGRKVVSGLHTFAVRDRNGKTGEGYRTYLLNHPLVVRELRRIATGISVYSISKTNLSKVKLPLPALDEQKAIANILSLMDTSINKNNLLISQKELQKKWLMQNLLTRKKRLKGFEKEKWSEVELGNFIQESRIPSIDNNVHQRITVKLNLKGIEKRDVRGSEAEDATYYFIRKVGQFIYGKQNLHKGAFGIIPHELNGFESSQDIPTFDFIGNINPMFFFLFLSQENVYKSLERISTGTGSKRIHPDSLYKVKYLFPELREQTAIAEMLQISEKEIQLLKTKVEKLRKQKNGMMQILLTGKKRLTTNSN